MNFFKQVFSKILVRLFQKKEQIVVSGGQALFFLLPEAFQDDFEVRKLQKQKTEWILIAQEKQDRIPEQLQKESKKEGGRDIVLNGFKPEVEVVSFPLTGKPLYIHFCRRKWKKKGEKKSYSNEYDFHPKGMKATKEFGDFLKGLSRQERCEFFLTFPHLRHIRKKDIPVV